MKRVLSFALAAALLATPMAASVASAGGMQFEVKSGSDWNDHWSRSNDNWRWHNRHQRRHQEPGFSFHFGVPAPFAFNTPRRDDCFRDRNGRLYCRAY